MSGLWSRLNRGVHRLVTSPFAPAPCALCGRGYASIGWAVDPVGRMHGRCPGCGDEVATIGSMPPSTTPTHGLTP
jgi:hypothetical protein